MVWTCVKVEYLQWFLSLEFVICLYFTSEKVISPLKNNVAFLEITPYVTIVYYFLSNQRKTLIDNVRRRPIAELCFSIHVRGHERVLSDQQRQWENTNIHWKCLLTRPIMTQKMCDKHWIRQQYNNVYVEFIQRVTFVNINEPQTWTVHRWV